MSFDFTAEQLNAIESRDGSLFLHANAGSGKTSVLVERFVRAVREDDVGVDRILAITFTDKAAAEMRSRVRERLLELGERERAREAEAAAISTIHAFCSGLLRGNALDAGNAVSAWSRTGRHARLGASSHRPASGMPRVVALIRDGTTQ